MSSYKLNWITEHLAVGQAPMSYDELDSILNQGVDAIVNLCGEYSDLHLIEKDHGFDVYHIPVADDEAPRLEEMEKALEWLDEAIYLGKRVLVHCRMGIGRTGTFITSYLLRRGFGLKLAEQKLKKIGSTPSSFTQWRMLRKYGKQEGRLTVREPSLETSRLVDLSPYFREYEHLLKEADTAFDAARQARGSLPDCGRDTDACCGRFLYLQLAEAAYLSYHLNKTLSREDRLQAVQRAVAAARGKANAEAIEGCTVILAVETVPVENTPGGRPTGTEAGQRGYLCPLSVDGKCIVYACRPVACRVFGLPVVYRGKIRLPGEGSDEVSGIERTKPFPMDHAGEILYEISRRLFFALNGTFLEGRSLLFPLTNVVSGKFVQDYFSLLNRMTRSTTPSSHAELT